MLSKVAIRARPGALAPIVVGAQIREAFAITGVQNGEAKTVTVTATPDWASS